MDGDNDPIAKALEAQGAFQMTAWTLRLAEHGGFEWMFTADPHLFALFYATCAVAMPAPQELAGTSEPAQNVSDKLLPTLRDLRRQFDHETSGRFARLYLQGTSVYPIAERGDGVYRRGVRAWRADAEEKASECFTAQEQNIEWVAELLSLDVLERKLLIFQLNRHRPGFEQLFDLLADSDRTLAGVLAAAFGVTERDVLAALSEKSKLVCSGLLDVEERPLHIGHPSSHLRATLTEAADDEADFLSRFVKRLTPSPSMASLARLHEDDRRILAGILRSKMPAERGLHVLVHGPKSVDKRDMIATLMQEEGIDGYAVVSKRVPSSDLPTWVYLAQRHLERSEPEAVLVIDRAHDALDSSHDTVFRFLGLDDDDDDADDESGRASDEGLTSSRVRCVWLTDRAKALSERNLGAFLFHCEALPGSRADRRKRVSQVIADFGLSEQLERHLAKYSLLGEQQVRKAAELARVLAEQLEDARDAPPGEREQVVKRAVAHSQKVLGRDDTEKLRDSVTAYSLDFLNLGGRFTPEKIIESLRRHRKGSLCFWGIPGAGKTQLAEHIAVELDVPIIMRSASELLSKWLGETEQHIAAMFEAAEAEEALLFLDEADSFLRDRTLARAEWAVMQVNEVLQRMERFDGIFIAATNLMDSLDTAAMRRFTWKLEFKALTPEQAWSMFCAETGFNGNTNQEEAVRLKQQLSAIADLAPGDFATVKRQANMLDEQLTPSDWLEQLNAEANAKMAGLRRQKLGFAA